MMFHSRQRHARPMPRLAIGLLPVVAALLAGCPPPPAVTRGPNVLLISIDSLRADRLGCYGYERPTSPRIDALAEAGALFESCYSSTSWTLPAHAALFTGLPDSAHGCDSNERILAPAQQTLAEVMRSGGWQTIGFWSGPYLHPRFGLSQGFDRWISCTGYEAYGKKSLAAAREVGVGQAPVGESAANARSHRDVTGPRVTAAVEEFLRAREPHAPPFLAFVHLWDVHYDYIPPAEWARPFVDPEYDGPIDGSARSVLAFDGARLSVKDLAQLEGLYDGEIAWTDHHVGLIVDLLDELGLSRDTLVVVVSDHGEEFFEHGRFGHRQQLHEESVRVPWILRWPEHVAPGTRVGGVSSLADVAPTLLELVGLPDELARANGLSHAAALTRAFAPGGPVAEAAPRVTNGLALSELELLGGGRRVAARDDRWSVLVDPARERVLAAFDRLADPNETRDRIEPGDPPTVPEDAKKLALDALTLLQRLRELHRTDLPPGAPLPPELESELRALGYLAD